MYRLLVVDDEPIVVEGLLELFRQQQLSLEVYRAYDGLEALELARSLRMDIILTDIQMPEMDGMELQRHVLRLWPRCRFIFLSGYNQFNYIQTTMRRGAVDFVLKTEGEERIVAAVETCMREIEEELNRDSLLSAANSQMQQMKHALRGKYLMELLKGEQPAHSKLLRKFNQLAIPLDPEEPVHMVVGRIDRWQREVDYEDRLLFYFSIDNMLQELLAPYFISVHLMGDRERFIWLLQPHRASPGSGGEPLFEGQLQAFIMGSLEAAQTMCRTYLKLVCSFVATGECCPWEHLPFKFDRLNLMFDRGLGLGEEMLLSDERMFAEGREQASRKVNRLRLLDQYLHQKNKEQFEAHFREITDALRDSKTMQTGLSLEIFYEMTAIFITHINRLDLFHVLSGKINISKLLSIAEHASWQDAIAFFEQLAKYLFLYLAEENEQETSEVVHTIHEYIDRNLQGDLSLNRLADLVYLTPFYVSRIYKANTGKNISDYIVEMRIDKAKRLLSESQLKIHEIGERVGYDSAPYFSRFFKKMIGMTPQEFRDSVKRI